MSPCGQPQGRNPTCVHFSSGRFVVRMSNSQGKGWYKMAKFTQNKEQLGRVLMCCRCPNPRHLNLSLSWTLGTKQQGKHRKSAEMDRPNKCSEEKVENLPTVSPDIADNADFADKPQSTADSASAEEKGSGTGFDG